MSNPRPGPVSAAPLAAAKLAPAGSGLVLAEWTAPGSAGAPDQPEYQAPLHVHHDDDEAWYVLDGRLRVRVGDVEHDVPAGAAVIGPHGLPHTFWNPDTVPVRYLLVMSARTSALLDSLHGEGSPSGPEAMRDLFEAYGCTLLE